MVENTTQVDEVMRVDRLHCIAYFFLEFGQLVFVVDLTVDMSIRLIVFALFSTLLFDSVLGYTVICIIEVLLFIVTCSQ